MQVRSPHTSVDKLSFDGVLVIVGGGAVDLELLRELYLNGGRLVGADRGADIIVDFLERISVMRDGLCNT